MIVNSVRIVSVQANEDQSSCWFRLRTMIGIKICNLEEDNYYTQKHLRATVSRRRAKSPDLTISWMMYLARIMHVQSQITNHYHTTCCFVTLIIGSRLRKVRHGTYEVVPGVLVFSQIAFPSIADY
jgi:hypothetical protein